jgi:GAF domain-containing protein
VSPADAAAVCLAERLADLGADAGYVGVPAANRQTVEVARVTPFSSTPVRLAFPFDAPYPLVETLRTGQPLFIGSNEELVCAHPGLMRVVADDHACATVPLVDADGAVLGALNISFEDPHPFSESERERIAEAARSCAEAIAALR